MIDAKNLVRPYTELIGSKIETVWKVKSWVGTHIVFFFAKGSFCFCAIASGQEDEHGDQCDLILCDTETDFDNWAKENRVSK